jgi:hypothetical protein
MKSIKKYWIIVGVVLPIIILVIIRSTGRNHFKNDVKRWAEPSLKTSNLVTIAQADELPGSILIINLDKDLGPLKDIHGEIRNVSPDSVLSKKQGTSIIKHGGPVLIFSSEKGISARIWMILSQMGCKKIFILTDQTDNESIKYKFSPDTIIY